MVVMGHFIRQSGLLESEAGANGTINIFLGSGGRIAVNIFLLIGSWFMVDSVFRPAKALKLYLETAFYCIPITILLACLGMAGGAQNINARPPALLRQASLVCLGIHIADSSYTIPKHGVSPTV